MVCPGNPPRGHTSPATPDRAGFRDRLVCMATSAPGHGTSLTSQTKGATVVVARCFADRAYRGERIGTATAITVEIVEPEAGQKGFAVQPRRWFMVRCSMFPFASLAVS